MAKVPQDAVEAAKAYVREAEWFRKGHFDLADVEDILGAATPLMEAWRQREAIYQLAIERSIEDGPGEYSDADTIFSSELFEILRDEPRVTSVDVSVSKQCMHDLGTRPYWMSIDQYDPCRCLLPVGHIGLHRCSHGEEEL